MKRFELRRKFRRWRYVLATYADYASLLNRVTDVQNILNEAAAGRRPIPDAKECLKLSGQLGVPPWADYRK